MKNRLFYRRGPNYTVWRQLFCALVSVTDGIVNIVAAPFGYDVLITINVLQWLAKRDIERWRREAINRD